MEEFLVREGNRNRVKVKKACLYCKNDFLVSKHRYDKAKFCNRQCANHFNYDDLRITVKCAYCGASFKKKSSALSGSKSGLYFCNREHKDLAQRVGGIKEIQPPHYRKAGSTYRDIAFRELPNQCEICKYNKIIEVLIVHHKDRDRENASIDNLQILCPTCHAEEHFLSKDGLWSRN